jgi:drug/metabolite transporter (DMT)-like permease
MSEALSALPAAKQERAALALLICGALAISFSSIFVRLSELGPSATAFHRLFLALPLLMAWSAIEGSGGGTQARPRSVRDWFDMTVCGLFFAADLIGWHWSLKLTTVADAIVLSNTAPIFVSFAAWLLFGERPTRLFVAGLALGVFGAAVLAGGSLAGHHGSLGGDGLAVLTATMYAGYILAVKSLRGRFTAGAIMTWSGIVSCLALLVAAYVSGESLLPASLHGWAVLFGLAWISHAGGQGMIAWALAHLPASFSSVTLLINPVAASFLAWPILGEAIGPWQAAGATLVLVGVGLSRRANAMV